jgi:hypothetical protein
LNSALIQTASLDQPVKVKIQLPPGTYSGTFGLGRFNTVKRTALNPRRTSRHGQRVMNVGAVEETIISTGQSPIVVTRSVT